MRVMDLEHVLTQFNSEARVVVTWEGVIRDIDPSSIYVSPKGTVIIDADENSYKQQYLNGRKIRGEM